ncbi:MAG: type III-B CRISPR-associated protein Cas10/Cmr2 [Bacteroidales bacterium]|nr:type III-B CRISPR-associated protein Cas10/Cmr2 [Bacteroidales bacterium]
MKHLFIFTIPSVQEFISQARKTQDLYAGSKLLSDLMSYAAKDIFVGEFNGKLIFPDKDAETFTNRFLGKIETDTPKKIGAEIEEKLKKYFFDIATEAVKKIIKKKLPKGFDEQINNLLDIKWAFVEWDGKNETYSQAYDKLERIIGAVKNVRDFEQLEYQKVYLNEEDKRAKKLTSIIGERGRKCSVDGVRNVKFYRKTDDDLEREKKEEKKDRLYTLEKKLFLDVEEEVFFITEDIPLKYIDYGEGLSAVSFVKRTYKANDIDFPSTAKIALMKLEKDNPNEFDKYQKLFNKNDFPTLLITHYDKLELKKIDKDFNDTFDYHYFYKENLTEKEFLNKEQLKWVKKWNKKFIKPLIGENKNRYYAIIAADGDSMGEQLSNVKSLEEHRKISEVLSEFSEKVRKLDYINDNNKLARVVYSGGDDILAFVNLDYLFDFLREVRGLYESLLRPVAEELNNTEDRGFNSQFLQGQLLLIIKLRLV